MKKLILGVALLMMSLLAMAQEYWSLPANFNGSLGSQFYTSSALDPVGAECVLVYYTVETHPRSKCAKFGAGISMVDGVLIPNLIAGPKGDIGNIGLTGDKGDQGLSGSPASNDWSTMTNKPNTVATLGVSDAATTTALATKYTTPSCPTSQYLRGDGSCLAFPSIPAAQVQTDWNAGSGIGVLLNKPTLAAVATSGAYADLSGKPIINRARVTTATDGTYTWTLPTACGSGQVPVMSMVAETSVAGQSFDLVVVGTPTNTSVSIKATPISAVTILAISVLGIQSATASVIHLLAICP